MHVRKLLARKSGEPTAGQGGWRPGPRMEPRRGTHSMNGRGQSDRSVVPGKLANNERGAPRSAEPVEERDLTKGNAGWA